MFTPYVMSEPETNDFGLDKKYEIEFRNDDGSVRHQYTKVGRFVIVNGQRTEIQTYGPTGKLGTGNDVRFSGGRLSAIRTQLLNHVVEFEAVAEGVELAMGAVDLSDLRPKMPDAPTQEQVDQRAFQAAKRDYDDAKQLVETLAQSDPKAADDLAALLEKKKAVLDAAAKPVIDAKKAEAAEAAEVAIDERVP